MNITEAVAWQAVADFLRGDLDHADEATRADIVGACVWLDKAAHNALRSGTVSAPQDWDEHLCHVTTEER